MRQWVVIRRPEVTSVRQPEVMPTAGLTVDEHGETLGLTAILYEHETDVPFANGEHCLILIL